MAEKKFDPSKYMTNLQGKDYLEVKWRLVWFRDEHPGGAVVTEIVSINDGAAVVKCSVIDENGVLLGTGHGMATPEGSKQARGRYLEKAETSAIGRALAHAGYGTQFSGEDEGEHLADSPVEQPAPAKKQAAAPAPQPPRNVQICKLSQKGRATLMEQGPEKVGLDPVHFKNRLLQRYGDKWFESTEYMDEFLFKMALEHEAWEAYIAETPEATGGAEIDQYLDRSIA